MSHTWPGLRHYQHPMFADIRAGQCLTTLAPLPSPVGKVIKKKGNKLSMDFSSLASQERAGDLSLPCHSGPALMPQAGYKTNGAGELHQPPRVTRGSQGAWWSTHELGQGFDCYWKMLPSTLFNLWFYKCAVPNGTACSGELPQKRLLWKTWTVNKTEEDLEHVVNSSCLLCRCTPPHTLLANDDFLIYLFLLNRFQLLSHRGRV